MQRLHHLIPIVALLALSCSSGSTAPPAPGTGIDSRGKPLTGEHAFDVSTTLAWSQATQEILGAAAGGGTTGGPGLIAVRAADGALRMLDPVPVLFPALTSDGAGVLYDAVLTDAAAPANDSTLLRVRLIGGSGSVTRISGCPGLCAATFVLSSDDRYIAWSGPAADPLEPDSVRVLDRVSGARRTFAPAEPTVFAPDDGTLLVHNPDGAGGYATLALASGTLTPLIVDLPAGATGSAFRWDASGLRVLYVINGKQLREKGPSGDALLFTAPDPIDAGSLTWARDGSRAALWTIGPIDSGTDTAWRLYSVQIGNTNALLVAVGRSAGHAITYSPDGTHLAYLYADRLFTASVGTPAP